MLLYGDTIKVVSIAGYVVLSDMWRKLSIVVTFVFILLRTTLVWSFKQS